TGMVDGITQQRVARRPSAGVACGPVPYPLAGGVGAGGDRSAAAPAADGDHQGGDDAGHRTRSERAYEDGAPPRRLRILVAGGRGMIGSAVAQRLRQAGHEVVLAGRGQGAGLFLDFNALPPRDELVRLLQGHDVLLNAVGIFQAQAEQSFDAVHVKAVAALFGAAVQAGIGRLVHLSALGAALGGATAYFDSKGRAEVLLRQLPAPVVIVRPSLVFSPEGASSRFFLRLATLPVLPLPGGGPQLVQPLHVDDLVEALVRVMTCTDD